MPYQDYIQLDEKDDLITRDVCDVPDLFDKQDDFNLKNTGRRYDHQFFPMYQARLNILKQRVDSQAMEIWGNGTLERSGQIIRKIDKILNITSNQLCWVSGTVFCDLNNKLNIFKDVESGTDDVVPLIPDSYKSQDSPDVVMIEDESGRAILQGEEFFKNNILVTGTVVAVLGIELQAGIFDIVDIIYPSVSPQKPLAVPEKPHKIAFVSGLEILTAVDYDMKLELLKLYLQGLVGSNKDKHESSEISQIVIAGSSVKQMEQADNTDYHSMNNYGSKNISRFNFELFKLFDKFITELVHTLNVTVMPGPGDPTDLCVPQQPLHKSFFTHCKPYVGTNIKPVTNPAWLQVDGVRVLGTAGQNIDDMVKYLDAEKRSDESVSLTCMEATVNWQNIAPTAPDTLYCYPFNDCDPFTLTETPHVYFTGNQPSYQSKVVDAGDCKVRIFTVPKYSNTGQIVLLDTQTLETEVVQISLN